MAAARRLVAAHERLVRRVYKKHLRVHALLAQLLHDAAEVVEQLLAARVHNRGDAVIHGRGVVCEHVHELRKQRGRKIVDSVKALILKYVESRGLPRPRHTRDYDAALYLPFPIHF